MVGRAEYDVAQSHRVSGLAEAVYSPDEIGWWQCHSVTHGVTASQQRCLPFLSSTLSALTSRCPTAIGPLRFRLLHRRERTPCNGVTPQSRLHHFRRRVGFETRVPHGNARDLAEGRSHCCRARTPGRRQNPSDDNDLGRHEGDFAQSGARQRLGTTRR